MSLPFPASVLASRGVILMMTFTNRHIGRFKIPGALINDHPKTARAVLSEVIVLGATYDVVRDEMVYVAQCDAFAELSPGDEIRNYTAQL